MELDQMNEKQDELIILVDDQGNEVLYQILFTFDSDDYEKSYVLLIPADAQPEEQVDVLAFSYDPADANSELREIESDEEWNMVEGVLDTFLNDDKLQ
ncbi:hypothetical protein FD21_GL000622 [Liquorilactobacillus vini DSM 20605]|uniref:UPF0473 protein FD21_GL000622 n=2 Tax=Liquorilactobacillus vini TaxID=238015 RepID=A0A0R2CBD4_9LACO|nr:hypothetical protein FD21_GL000622 [Liquorilactobacillus vini DSM 20605]